MMAEAIEVFGHQCNCPNCEVSDRAFLTVDHIDSYAKGRKRPIKEAKDSGWDKTRFQILCFNCNCAKRDKGFCPVHQSSEAATNNRQTNILNARLFP